MTEISINIQPPLVSKPVVTAAVQYVNVKFVPSEWATIRVIFLDEDGKIVIAHDVTMTLEESQLWLGDDTYVLNLALQKLGIQLLQ